MAAPDEFDPDQPTPTELLPEEGPPRTLEEADREADHNQLLAQGKRLAELEKQLTKIEEMLQHSNLDRVARHMRLLRRYLASWVKDTVGGDVDLVTQVRKMRKYIAVWLSED
jgi:hypothetical protein